MITTIVYALFFGILACAPAGVVGFILMRWLRRDYARHRAALYDEATRAFNNARLANWQQIARAKAQNTKGNPL